ncbi:MAG: TIGR03013 family XrtA/PEP-CTERM system glycosyltransferase [Thermomonas sp.]
MLMFAVVMASRIRFHHDPETYAQFIGEFGLLKAFVVAAFVTLAKACFGLYQVHVRYKRGALMLRQVLAFAFGGIALLVLYYLVPAAYVGRGVLAIALALGLLMVVMTRFLLEYAFGLESFRRRVLVLGAGSNAEMINTRLRRRADRNSFTIMGFVPVAQHAVSVRDELLLDAKTSLSELANALQIQEIVVATDERRGALPMQDLLLCAQRGIVITDLSTFFERELGVVLLNASDPSWLVFTGHFDHSAMRRLSKRLFDLLAASTLLLLAWPVMLMVAALVRLESAGPIFYRQTRVGQDGYSFDLYKFRSMRLDAESDGVARWAGNNDDRTTRVGRFIRSTRLDELPQLVNVMMGQMSFVGPRPERPQFVDMLNQQIRYYDVRHCMKPGLTGWAQLRYPYGASVDDAAEKLKFDLFYVKNHGLLFDFMILLQTVEVVLFRQGAR